MHQAFNARGYLSVLTGMDWRDTVQDPLTGVQRLEADAERAYAAEVFQDGPIVALSISPALHDGTPMHRPHGATKGIRMRGGRINGVDWVHIAARNGQFWRVVLDRRRTSEGRPSVNLAAQQAS